MNKILSLLNLSTQVKSYNLQKSDSEFNRKKNLYINANLKFHSFVLGADGKITYFPSLSIEITNNGSRNIIIKNIEIIDKLENLITKIDISHEKRKIMVNESSSTIINPEIDKELIKLIKNNQTSIRICDIENQIYICENININTDE